MTKQQLIMIDKLKSIAYKNNKNKLFPEKDIEISDAKIKNITQAILAYGAQYDNFIGMLTLTYGKNRYDRILIDDYESTIIQKTQKMYYGTIYFLEELKKELRKNSFKFIYICAFELQKDGNLHAHIYFSAPIKAFNILFDFYFNYGKHLTESKTVTINKKPRNIIPIGRAQLGISYKFKQKLEEKGAIFEKIKNPQKDRYDYRYTNLVSDEEFKSGSWPTLFFYSNEELKNNYDEKIINYLTKNVSKQSRQKAIAGRFVKHNLKMVYDDFNYEWKEIQKAFIRKICRKLYIASRLPISVTAYQKYRKHIIETYDRYKNLNTLITDLVNGKAKYDSKTKILTCANKKIIYIGG